MKKIFLCMIFLLLATILNYKTDFGFVFNIDLLIILWLLFYVIILPIGLMSYLFIGNETKSKLYRLNTLLFFLYLLSVLLSGLDFINFKHLKIEADGETEYVLKIIFISCFIFSTISFVCFQLKVKRLPK